MNLEGNETMLATANNYITEDVRHALGARIFPAGSIVFPKVGGAIATNKKRQVVRPSCVDNNVMGLVPDESVVDRDYLRHWMLEHDIYAFSNKANPPSITQSTVRAWPFLLPPLEEQKRIVAVLDQAFAALDRARANAEANLASSSELFEAQLERAFHATAAPAKKSSLTGMASVLTDGDWIEKKDQSTSGFRLVQTGNVGVGAYKSRDHKARFIDIATFTRLNCFEVVPGDILISRLPDPVGRSCIVPDIGSRMITAVDCCVLRLDPEVMDARYFVYYTRTQRYLRAIDEGCTGTTRRRISRKNLGRVAVPILPVCEQKRVVAELDELFARLDAIRKAFASKLQHLADLRQSILQKAFAGELT